eukprot:TRINITY_DN16214_c0_g1_i1.p2 TRINITY_DN16214_c0_g1~~TRINITY_DN16214_c0_g1_i1.p2  ORF type:complete len:766 (-),score=202.94 TRINITY_DN16214_c0_g1_i1:99-2396(-)
MLRFVTVSEYEAARPGRRDGLGAATPASAQLRDSEVIVLVMASRGLEERVALIEQAWAHSAVERRYLVDDWLDAVPRARQWRPPAPQEGWIAAGASPPQAGAVAGGYWDAQSRQLSFMNAHPTLHEQFKWILLADDDTFVNVDRLLGFARRHDSRAPVLFTYVLSDAHVLTYDYPCGGAGMLLSAGAYALVAPHILTAECPMLSFNDLTLGFCVHRFGIPLVHNHNMRCSPDLNRAMRSGENLLDLQRGISIHRLPGFMSFDAILSTIDTMEGQLRGLLDYGCKFAPQVRDGLMDSRRFFWTAGAFADAVAACRGMERSFDADAALHLEFAFFGRGVPVARYHRDRQMPNVALPRQRAMRWPEWLEQLRSLDCAGHGDSWHARWLDAAPRISRRQVLASDLDGLARDADLGDRETLEASFAELEASTPLGSWLEVLRDSLRPSGSALDADARDTAPPERRRSQSSPAAAPAPSPPSRGSSGSILGKTEPGRTWLYLSFAPSTTFVNVFESLAILRSLSSLYRAGGRGEAGAFYGEDVYGAVDLAASEPPPLGLAYEYFDLNVEQDAGVWLNGVALSRLLRCPAMKHPIVLDPEGHANDWESVKMRLELLWHNALAVDIFRTLRFCGVLLLHTPQMVPHGLSYLPYSTNRRVHLSSVAAAMSIGNVISREQMFSMSQLVRQRACRLRRKQREARAQAELEGRGGEATASSWRPSFRLRALGGCSDLELDERQWLLPGGRFLGQALVAFRSEHFLPDAQAVGSKPMA